MEQKVINEIYEDFSSIKFVEDEEAEVPLELVAKWSKSPPYGYINTSEKFDIPFSDRLRLATNQYNQIYQTRYKLLEDSVKTAFISQNKGSPEDICTLWHLPNEKSALVIGTIFRKSAKRPSVLVTFDDIEEEDGDVQLTVDENPDELVSDEDWLEVEDSQTQSIKLGGLKLNEFATGMVVGLFGRKTNGEFHVDYVVYPGPPKDRIPRPVLTNDCFILFMSGIQANTENSETWAHRFRQLRTALSVPPYDNNIERVILCGNLSVDFCDCSKCAGVSWDDVKHLGATKDSSRNQAYVNILDVMAHYFVDITIDLMPGSEDPASAMWPQQPLSVALTKKFVFKEGEAEMEETEYEEYSSGEEEIFEFMGGPIPRRTTSFINAVPNPYQFEHRGFRFLGTSGQNVDYLRRMTDPKNHPGTVMEKMIDLAHVCPTAPQAPDCFPFDVRCPDPFVIESLPHVFFVGNQDKAFCYSREYPGNEASGGKSVEVQFLSIPQCKKTLCGYILNLRTMELDAISVGEESKKH
ncbi:hypothetical protein FO519_000243 [Halicephalobus sp. NKZ332]|nr:hypothetical protein FO519_000243 [Halicephalobus sp. NKZ332]